MQVCNPIRNEKEDISFPLYVVVQLFPHSKEKIMLIIGLMPLLQSLVRNDPTFLRENGSHCFPSHMTPLKSMR